MLARRAVAELTGVDPRDVRLDAPRWKPPRVVRPSPGVTISIAHAHGRVLVAAARGADAVGADLECLDRLGPDPLAVAQIVGAPEELAPLEALPATDRAEMVLRLWALKEAVAKATGLGIRLPFDRWIIVSPEQPRPLLRAPVSAGDAWRLTAWHPRPGFVAALALRANQRATGLSVPDRSAAPGLQDRRIGGGPAPAS